MLSYHLDAISNQRYLTKTLTDIKIGEIKVSAHFFWYTSVLLVKGTVFKLIENDVDVGQGVGSGAVYLRELLPRAFAELPRPPGLLVGV